MTRDEEKLGLNSSTTSDIVVDALVGGDRLLHKEGKGFAVAMATLDGGRIGIAAQAVGIAQAAYEAALAYARRAQAVRQADRRAAGDPAQARRHVDGDRRCAAARLRAAWLKEQGRPHAEEGAKAKLFASEVARRQTAEAIQVFGGYGYTKEFPVERYYRDAKITEIYEGTSEIQRLVIARSILGLKSGSSRPGRMSAASETSRFGSRGSTRARATRARRPRRRLARLEDRSADRGGTARSTS